MNMIDLEKQELYIICPVCDKEHRVKELRSFKKCECGAFLRYGIYDLHRKYGKGFKRVYK
jgi:ferredoxin-thioredoxin reductase catalytic subunit